ncbi:ATPase AAA [Desulfuromonas versatilis]|uniref:ATPase AAA n=1 Tax=Desulfuromonas versatilis TaxID=2802975 RepID=A0ABN6DUG5_9BACT|nr:serine protein kinase PrkA [Desulfuromonas versatilis]BCR03766.1 ATPase AAA [Desulfuromonas versatilis]
MKNIHRALHRIDRSISEWEQRPPVSFDAFLARLTEEPAGMVRNIFQVFHDLIKGHITDGTDEYPDDPESIHYVSYDFTPLFVDGVDNPFFADRLFANRLVTLVEALNRGAQQNKIYIFEGPHGCGKSTFLNNLLLKFEQFVNTEKGALYETVWRLSRADLGGGNDAEHVLERLSYLLDHSPGNAEETAKKVKAEAARRSVEYLEVPCPSHDHPLLMVPKNFRRQFLDDLFGNTEFKWRLFTEKEYEWVFRDSACTICSSLYQTLLGRLRSPARVLQMVYARPFQFNRRLSEGVSVFNPGDKPMKKNILSNSILQSRLNELFRDSNLVRYIFSRFAKTNNGVYALMDVKAHNVERLIELHNIISEGVHKVDDVEEHVNSLFLALMNPEDRENIREFQSFSDRIEYIKIPYVLDLKTEVEIYRNIFGKHIEESFLPRVLHNFARVIIATRLNAKSEAMLEWIPDPEKYRLYCDENLQLLKMEIYTGFIPRWLSEEDVKRLTAKRRRRIIGESEKEGGHGLTGRDSIKLFNDFFSTYARPGELINMSILGSFFTKRHPEVAEMLPRGFLDSLLRMYNYSVLQEVKESLYYYNEDQIARDISNYLFAINFEAGSVETCRYTGERLEISEEFFGSIERRILGPDTDAARRLSFRKATQKEYTSQTLTQEIMAAGRPITETGLFGALRERYVHNLKEKVLDPFLENENFRRAIKDYGREDFKTYDKRIRADVSFLIRNLCSRYRYTENGARDVCMYVIDNDLARQFS